MHLQFPKEEFAVLQQINSFFFKGKNATAPLSQGGVNLLRLSTNAAPVFTDQCPRPEETFDPVWFLVKLDCSFEISKWTLIVYQRNAQLKCFKDWQRTCLHPTGLPPITLPSVIYSRHKAAS